MRNNNTAAERNGKITNGHYDLAMETHLLEKFIWGCGVLREKFGVNMHPITVAKEIYAMLLLKKRKDSKKHKSQPNSEMKEHLLNGFSCGCMVFKKKFNVDVSSLAILNKIISLLRQQTRGSAKKMNNDGSDRRACNNRRSIKSRNGHRHAVAV